MGAGWLGGQMAGWLGGWLDDGGVAGCMVVGAWVDWVTAEISTVDGRVGWVGGWVSGWGLWANTRGGAAAARRRGGNKDLRA